MHETNDQFALSKQSMGTYLQEMGIVRWNWSWMSPYLERVSEELAEFDIALISFNLYLLSKLAFNGKTRFISRERMGESNFIFAETLKWTKKGRKQQKSDLLAIDIHSTCLVSDLRSIRTLFALGTQTPIRDHFECERVSVRRVFIFEYFQSLVERSVLSDEN